MDTPPKNESERRIYWLATAKNHPPEWLASYVHSPKAPCAIITEDGPAQRRIRCSAYLNHWDDAPYWAFALVKSYLDDVGEWPLAGIQTELALAHHESRLEQGQGQSMEEIEKATREILLTVKSVWPDVDLIYIGEEKS
ncbi:MAG: hypothetical protein HQL72_02940 [Magnetococcales bacterium]|nr:hypothetical protein [Magnetococcales bacterium]